MRALLMDLRCAARILRQNPGFGLIAVLALALGTGATTAMFSVVDAVLLGPLPYPEPDRLAWVAVSFPKMGLEFMLGPDYLEWSQQNHVFENLTAFDSTRAISQEETSRCASCAEPSHKPFSLSLA